MPTLESVLLQSLSRSTRPPSYRGYGGGDRLIDLMQQRADFEAEAGQQRAALWGGLFQNLGGIATNAIAQHEKGKRDKAWMSFINEGGWQNDPQKAYARTLEIWGPEEGAKQWQGLVAATQLMQPKRDPDKDQKALGAVSGAYLGMSPEARAQLYPTLRGLVSSAVPGMQMPEQHDPTFDESVVLPFARQYAPQPKREKVTTRNSDGTEVTQFVDPNAGGTYTSVPEPEKPKEYSVTVPGPDGRPVQRLASEAEMRQGVPAYREPKAPREPSRPVQIETVDENGKPVTRFVTPEAGASYPKPTGAARPASGQQRKALSFFNRGLEADKIAVELEQGDQISPTRQRYTPDWANVTLSTSDQQYRQAQRAFTEARLRKESGATIKDEEYDNDAKTYFPQPGDDDETKAQKRAMRQAVLAGIALESGDALREFYGDEAEGMLAGLRAAGQSRRPDTGRPVQVRTPEDYNRLPVGAAYIDPNGVRRRKGGR